QAEDGIRDKLVTGVQTCALPISDGYAGLERINNSQGNSANVTWTLNDGSGSILFVGSSRYGPQGQYPGTPDGGPVARYAAGTFRSEERRVGKERRCGWWTCD